jgi:hypothetical protein
MLYSEVSRVGDILCEFGQVRKKAAVAYFFGLFYSPFLIIIIKCADLQSKFKK